MEDYQAYKAFPQHRKWFNKLYLSEVLDYDCGPSGIAPTKDAFYIVRPIYNLSGMSVGAKKVFIENDDYTKVKPGYFWCEWFEGDHISVSYVFKDNCWNPISAWQAYKKDLTFVKWQKTNKYPVLPDVIQKINNVPVINVEFIGNNVIEVHLRDTPDPQYDVLIPVWDNNRSIIEKHKKEGFSFIAAYEDADSFITIPRIGFMVKNNK